MLSNVPATDNHYTYDGYNRRVKSVEGSKTTYSFYSQSGKLFYTETAAGGINYIYLGNRLVAKDGFIPENAPKQHYLPFGASVEGEINDVGYIGHKFDKDIGLSYMQARYYDPVLGRFMSPDPIGSADQFNLYAYVGNDPVNRVDLTGKFSQGGIESLRASGSNQNALANMSKFQMLTTFEHQANSTSLALSRSAEALTAVSVTASAFDGGEIIGVPAGIAASMATLGAAALEVKPGSFSIAVAGELTAAAAGKKIEPLVHVLGSAKNIPENALERIEAVTSGVVGAVTGTATTNAMETKQSTSANDGFVLRVCSGTGAQECN